MPPFSFANNHDPLLFDAHLRRATLSRKLIRQTLLSGLHGALPRPELGIKLLSRYNAGLMTLATTNYPERLDAAIMDRPSRFDRKYHFALPKAEERLAFARKWSRSGETELNLSEETEERIVSETEGFSYAYLKELFVSSVMQWMASPAAEDMASILMSRVAALREEMKSAKATA
jgi:AAA+ superfamily predicted ATPase